MKNKNTGKTKMMIKAKFSNQVHKILEGDNLGKKRWDRRYPQLSDKQKIELFDQIVVAHKENSNELTSFMFEQREKKRLEKARIANGYYEKRSNKKKKTSKSEYEASKQAVA